MRTQRETVLGQLTPQSENKNTVLTNDSATLYLLRCICYSQSGTLTLEDCFQGHIFGQREKEC